MSIKNANVLLMALQIMVLPMPVPFFTLILLGGVV